MIILQRLSRIIDRILMQEYRVQIQQGQHRI